MLLYKRFLPFISEIEDESICCSTTCKYIFEEASEHDKRRQWPLMHCFTTTLFGEHQLLEQYRAAPILSSFSVVSTGLGQHAVLVYRGGTVYSKLQEPLFTNLIISLYLLCLSYLFSSLPPPPGVTLFYSQLLKCPHNQEPSVATEK